jgi:hypothetical protein
MSCQALSSSGGDWPTPRRRNVLLSARAVRRWSTSSAPSAVIVGIRLRQRDCDRDGAASDVDETDTETRRCQHFILFTQSSISARTGSPRRLAHGRISHAPWYRSDSTFWYTVRRLLSTMCTMTGRASSVARRSTGIPHVLSKPGRCSCLRRSSMLIGTHGMHGMHTFVDDITSHCTLQ